MRLFLRILLLTLLLPAAAGAQSNPAFHNGLVPTADDWNGYFASKLDYAPGADNALPYWAGGTLHSAPVSGDCAEAAAVFTCTKLGGVAPGTIFGLNYGSTLSKSGSTLDVTNYANLLSGPGTWTSGHLLQAGTYPAVVDSGTSWGAPGALGAVTPNSGVFSTLTANSTLVANASLRVGTVTTPSSGAIANPILGGVEFGLSGGGGIAFTPITGGGGQFYRYSGVVGAESYAQFLGIDNNGNATFNNAVAANGRLNVLGAASGAGASTLQLGWSAGIGQIYVMGADASTVGLLTAYGVRSDGSGGGNIFQSDSSLNVAFSHGVTAATLTATTIGTPSGGLGLTPAGGSVDLTFSGDARFTAAATNAASSAYLKLTGRQGSVDSTFSVVSVGSGLGGGELRFVSGDFTGTRLGGVNSSAHWTMNTTDATEVANIGGALRVTGSAANFGAGNAGGSIDYASGVFRIQAVPGAGAQGAIAMGLAGGTEIGINGSHVVQIGDQGSNYLTVTAGADVQLSTSASNLLIASTLKMTGLGTTPGSKQPLCIDTGTGQIYKGSASAC